LGSVWNGAIAGADRERAFRALEVATLFSLRRAVRNGSVWIEHSLRFRGRARLFFTDERWQEESKRHYARLSLPANASTLLKPLLAKVTAVRRHHVNGQRQAGFFAGFQIADAGAEARVERVRVAAPGVVNELQRLPAVQPLQLELIPNSQNLVVARLCLRFDPTYSP